MKSIHRALATILVLLLVLSLVGSYLGAASDSDWVSRKSMLTGRANFGLAQVDGKLYAMGGHPNTNTTEEYDPQTDTWIAKADMPTARFNFAVAVFENRIYCIGGLIGGSNFYEGSKVSGAIEVYDPAKDVWETKKPMPTPLINLQANVIEGKIFLIGGKTGGQYSTNAITQAYDPILETWTQAALMPYPVSSYASAVVENKIYVFGGQAESGSPMNLNTTQIYDTTQNSWTLGKPLAFPLLNSAACSLLNSKTIYVIGGQFGNNGNSTDTVQIYNVNKDSWSFGDSLPAPRFDLSVATVNNRIFAIGGTNRNILPSEQASPINEMLTASDTIPNPTPSVPEFSWLTILPILLAITIALLIVRERLQGNV